MTKGLGRPRRAIPGALVAPLVGALMIVGAPAATYATPRQQQPGNPPAAGSDEGHGAHSGHAGNPDRNGDGGRHSGDEAKDPRSGDQPRDPHAGEHGAHNGTTDKNPKAPDRDPHSGGHDGWYGHYDHDHFGYHGHHNWDTHRRYYRYGYAGPGWYDDCGYYGAHGSDGYYDSPDACDWQYGAQGQSLRANLSGDQEVPGPGAPNAFGTANLFADVPGGRLCYRLGYDGTDPATMAHIHRGGPGQTGEPVIDLHLDANGDEGCVPADPNVLRNVQDHPEAFYLNVHTAQYPDGAIRGQLFDTDRY